MISIHALKSALALGGKILVSGMVLQNGRAVRGLLRHGCNTYGCWSLTFYQFPLPGRDRIPQAAILQQATVRKIRINLVTSSPCRKL